MGIKHYYLVKFRCIPVFYKLETVSPTRRHIEKVKVDVSILINTCPDLVGDRRSRIKTARRQLEIDLTTTL
jgi:hypothetical protein